MPVEVHMPVGVRLSATPSASDLAALEVSTGDAVLRALDVVHEQVLTPRGAGGPLRFEHDRVHFTGDLPHDDLRAAVEQAVMRGLDHAARTSGTDAWHGPAAGTPPAALAGTRPGEVIDPRRVTGGHYEVPSYGDGGAPRGILVDEDFTVEEALDLHAVLEEAWYAHRDRFGGRWDPGSYGYPGYYGSFVADGVWMENQLVYFAHVDATDERGNPTTFRWQMGGFDMLRLDVGGPDAEPARTSLSPPLDHYVMTRTEHLGAEATLVQLMEAAAAEDPAYPHDASEIRQLAAGAAQPTWPVHRIDGGRHVGFVVLPPASTDGIGHSPIRFIAPMQTRLGTEAAGGQAGGASGSGTGTEVERAGSATGQRTGSGRTGGTGSRPRGGPLGAAEGEGNLWPTLGLGGEPLVCQAFLGEPPVSSLVVGGEALEERMRSLAAQLELDYCGYAGQFCLNLAQLIGARAHAIGVTSANSSVRSEVTLRADGDGNNGFVDIRPGPASELRYLETLGDLAVQVDRFANEVRGTYLRRENAHLIHWDEDRSLDPNPAAWSLRFLIAMKSALERSCMWLYAECCRVILLQQLRSSHEAIEARRSSFHETLQRFEEALGILGESVVRLSVLRRALAWARSHRLTGSVRSVLSHEPAPVSTGDGDVYQPPAPIQSVAPGIVDQLDAATVAREDGTYVVHYDGKRWTDAELETGVAMRRGILNRVDPLFLQVPDLERVYNRSRSDPASIRAYLGGVLDEMLRANEGTTRKTVERRDGAFFALEASQYIKARGGYNARGLKYDLQGIHALADDVLRSHTSGTDAYRRGINLAIGIKAGWDDFVSTFSTAGIVLLGVFCAPLGAGVALLVTSVAGLALTVHDELEADRMEELYSSLLDPEAILSWQDVQMQRFLANLSLAFAIFDVAGVAKGAKVIVGTLRTELRALAGQSIRGAARGAIGAARRQLVADMTREVLENAMKQAVASAAVIAAMSQLLPAVMQPVLVPWIRSVAVAHGTLREVDAALGPLAIGQPAPEALQASPPAALLEGVVPSDDAEVAP
jgi:hypothetical protein